MLSLTGKTEVIVTGPLKGEPADHYSRRNITQETAVKFRRHKHQIVVHMERHSYDIVSLQIVHENLIARVGEAVHMRTHTDQEKTEWLDLHWYGERHIQVWLSTPEPETWAKLHVWAKCDADGNDVFFDIIHLDEESRAALLSFVNGLQEER